MMHLEVRAAFAAWLLFSTSGCWLLAGVQDGETVASQTGSGGAGTGGSASASTGSTSSLASTSSGAGGMITSSSATTGGGGMGGMIPPTWLSPNGEQNSAGMTDSLGDQNMMWTYVDDPIGMPDDAATVVRTFIQNMTDCYHQTQYPKMPTSLTSLLVHVIATGEQGASCTAFVEVSNSSGYLAKGTYPGTFGADGKWIDLNVTVPLGSTQTDATFGVKLHLSNTTNIGSCAYTQVWIQPAP